MSTAASGQRHPAERPACPTAQAPLVMELKLQYKQHVHLKWGWTQPQIRHYYTTPMDRSALCRPIGVGERRTARRSHRGASLRIEPRASSPSSALRPAWLTFRLPAPSTPGPGSRPFLSSLPALGKANCHVRERKFHPFCDSGSQSSCSLPQRPGRLDARP